VLAGGFLLIVVALLIRTGLHRQADVSRLDSSPAHRVPNDTPYIPTPAPIVDEMIRVADLSQDDVVYDLGCGDGRILIAAAKQAGCHAVGFDIDPDLVQQARENARASGVDSLVTVEQRDVLTVDLSEASVVMIYLLPWIMEELIPQFDEMEPGSRIVAHDFRIAGCKPDETIEIRSDDGQGDVHYVHLWITPLKKGSAPK
jgi:SAM-dependent methyltransferase